eukprot:742138-Amphidinium_carterae.1
MKLGLSVVALARFFCKMLRRIMLLAAAYPAYCDALKLALQGLAATCATDHNIAQEVPCASLPSKLE